MYGQQLKTERRRDERVPISLSINRLEVTDVTRNISISGVYFETREPINVGERVDLDIMLSNPEGVSKLMCWAEIIRTEVRNNKIGVAAEIFMSVMS